MSSLRNDGLLVRRRRTLLWGNRFENVSFDAGYDKSHWRTGVSVQGVVAFDILLDIVDNHNDKVRVKVDVEYRETYSCVE